MKTTRIYILLALLLMAVFPSCAIIEINGLGNDYNDLDRIWTADKSLRKNVRFHRCDKNNQNLVIYKINVYLCSVKQLSNEYRRLLEHVIRACRSYPL